MTLLDEALALLRELRPHAPIESAWLTDPNARFDEEAWRNSPVATSSKMRDRIDDLLARTAKETSSARCTCKDFPGADQFCTAHKAGGTGESPESQQQRNSEWDRQREQIAAGLAKNR